MPRRRSHKRRWAPVILKPQAIILVLALALASFGIVRTIVSYHLERQQRLQEDLDAQVITKIHRVSIARLALKKETDVVWHGPVQPLNIQPGSAPVIHKIPTAEPVVFVGIDDGWTKDPEIQEWLVQHRLPFSMFLINDAAKTNYDYFRSLQNAGMAIEDHTLSHPRLSRLTLAGQRAEICGAANNFATVYGHRPTLLRPPYGAFNILTSQAAADCGLRAVVMWRVVVEKGTIYFQDNATQLEPGDIVLMHFRPELLQDIRAFINELQRDHLQIGRLEDWIQ